ncbi:hypothetical protein BDR05DRAFT_1004477 [Suillus weaverae]|nr:hypothetical protein BDR05DRAFT_1004477 [Suillus weaverae]
MEADTTETFDNVFRFNSLTDELSTPHTELESDFHSNDHIIDPDLLAINEDLENLSRKHCYDLLSPGPELDTSATAEPSGRYRIPSSAAPALPATKKSRPSDKPQAANKPSRCHAPSSNRQHSVAPSNRHAPSSSRPSAYKNAHTNAPPAHTSSPSLSITAMSSCPNHSSSHPNPSSSCPNAASSCPNPSSSRPNPSSSHPNAASSSLRPSNLSAHTFIAPAPISKSKHVTPSKNPAQPCSSCRRLSVPPVLEDDSDDDAIGSNMLSHHRKPISSKHRALTHSRVQLNVSLQHITVENLQSEIHKICKEQSKLVQDQSGTSAKLKATIEEIIK